MALPRTPSSSFSASPAHDAISDDDYVQISSGTFEEHQSDGDQTKYTNPTAYQSAAQTAKYTWQTVRSKPLTAESLFRHTLPLAQDLGKVAKDVTVAAAGRVSRALANIAPRVEVAAAACYYFTRDWEGGWNETLSAGPKVDEHHPERRSATNFSGRTTEVYPQEGHNEAPSSPETEDDAVAQESLNGEMNAEDGNSEVVNMRCGKERALDDWQMEEKEAGLRAKKQQHEAIIWSEKEDSGYDPLGHSDVYKRPVTDEAQAIGVEEIRKRWSHLSLRGQESFTDTRAARALSTPKDPATAREDADASVGRDADTAANEGE